MPHKAAANIYPVSSLDAIKSRSVPDIAADDCVLFMWTTVPHLEQAFEVINAWGFSYRSSAVWHKQYNGARQGMGYWFRINHEILLVATKGKVPAPAPGTQFGSVIVAPVGAHSEKPDVVYEMIEALYGPLPKIELNARARRAGWDAWGFEAPTDIHDASERIAMSFEEAKPILIARYETESGDVLAAELGRPVNTIRTWAHRLGLTGKARIAARGAAMVAEFNREKTS
jgi:N6-adenosine-specific RNA methylase IME4